MVTLATVPFTQFHTSTIEVDALEKRYTVDTLGAERQSFPGAEILFVVGTDMYQSIDTWKDFRRLFDLAHIVIVNRPGFPIREGVSPYRTLRPSEPVDLTSGNSVFFLPYVEQPISSTAIRDDRKRGGEVRQWLPPQVWSYIEKNNLYS